MLVTCEFGRLGNGEAAVVLQDSHSVSPRKPVKVGVRWFRAKKEGAAAALVRCGDCFDGGKKTLLVCLLLRRRLSLQSSVPAACVKRVWREDATNTQKHMLTTAR